MVQIKLKGVVIGVERPSPRSFWCGDVWVGLNEWTPQTVRALLKKSPVKTGFRV